MYTLFFKLCDWIIYFTRKYLFTDRILNKLHISWNTLEQFIRFAFVGVTNVIVSLIFYYLIIAINKRLFILGNTVGYIADVINSFFLNSKWVFKSEKYEFTAFIKTFICYLFTYVIQTLLLYLMIDICHWSEILAPIINIAITTPINFILNKVFAFNKKSGKSNNEKN